jgi:hypothetical protein
MRIDRYTKFVLTIIAACLVWLSLGGPTVLPTAQAQSNQVVIAGWIGNDGRLHPLSAPLAAADGIPVSVVYNTR